MTIVMRRKETLGVNTVLPEHLCQAECGCVMSRNLTAGATEVFLMCRAHVSGV